MDPAYEQRKRGKEGGTDSLLKTTRVQTRSVLQYQRPTTPNTADLQLDKLTTETRSRLTDCAHCTHCPCHCNANGASQLG
ncbi:hypothetical protein AOLI_G00156090 [Acnodon oligacanthus]